MENDDVAACTRTYTGVLKSFGSGTGMDFFARVVRPFVEYLLKKDQPREALQAVERARAAMRVQPKSQLEQEFHALEDRIHQALH
jgi:hypothetical protein